MPILSTGAFYDGSGGGGSGGGNVDPDFANVVLLVGFDGTDGATTATDESNSGRGMTFNGGTQIDTDQKKFGSASCLFSGIGDYINVSDSDDWYWPGEFTIEAWVRPNNSSASTGGIACQWANDSSRSAWRLGYSYSSGTAKGFQFQMSPTGSAGDALLVSQPSANIDQSVFHHVAVDRDANNIVRLYVDGVMVDSTEIVGAANVAYPMRIGRYTGTGSSWNGWCDELRITKGVARYASNDGFSVPTEAFPRS